MGLYNNGKVLPVPYYIATDYGVNTLLSNNTEVFQNLMNLVYENGGGIIYIPAGVYRFDTGTSTKQFSSNVEGLIQLRPNVSIIGESLSGTILKPHGRTTNGSALFVGSHGIFGEYVYGATYSNFTVDEELCEVDNITHKSKAFYTSGMYDCIFRDLRLLNTPSTALGIDMLNNVIIDSIYAENCGRGWSLGVNGCAGIGIGTGKWQEENFIIRNCVCVNCGHFGIFLEDQGIFDQSKIQNFPKGQTISNNICRNGRNYGIGLRGGKYVNIVNNNVYNNANGGIYLDYGASCANISGNLISGEQKAIHFGDESTYYVCDKISVNNNTFIDCVEDVVQTITPTNTIIQNNISI